MAKHCTDCGEWMPPSNMDTCETCAGKPPKVIIVSTPGREPVFGARMAGKSVGQDIAAGLADAIAGRGKKSTVDVAVCPTCGHRRAMTGAERQKAYRAKQKGTK